MKVIRGKFAGSYYGFTGYQRKLEEELSTIIPEKTNTGKLNWRGKEIWEWNWWAFLDSNNQLRVELYKKEYEKEFVKICKKYDVDMLWVEYYG